MKKIIVSMADNDAIEVRENNRLASRYGMNQLSFQSVCEKEQKIAQQCQEILKTKELPILIKGLVDYGILENDELQDFMKVLSKAHELLQQGFHVLIIRGMMECACGRPSELGYGCFDEKFSPAFTDVEVRQDFWETKHLFPIEKVSAFLLDLMNDVDPYKAGAENFEKSEFIRSCLTHYLECA
ncbi:MAG: hypothetical protein IJ660_07375 [Alphaproteobacteria bacterium]|nr:hypothetical protein [Alphaproteobacteria bacterium]